MPIEIRSDSNYFGRIVSKSMKCILPKGEAISEQLNTLGIKQKDINMCIITHMDNDHIGGAQQLKEIKKFLVSQEELIAAKKFNIRYIKKLWKDVDYRGFCLSKGILE